MTTQRRIVVGTLSCLGLVLLGAWPLAVGHPQKFGTIGEGEIRPAVDASMPQESQHEIRPATDAPPRTPEEAVKLFRLPAGLRIELVASEPLIADPTDVVFDERGRLFVCELHGWNLEGYLDIVELNKGGKLDREVRRIPASPAAKAAARKEQYGTVKMLEDTDGDGRMDRATVWADRLPPCYGLVPARGGVIAVCAPDIVYLADRDGDGRAEVRETLFMGFEVSLLERAINCPRWGPDNWIYVAAGGGGGTITGPRLAGPVRLGHSDFRFRPDGSAIEPVTGTCGTFGLALGDFGERFDIAGGGPALFAVPLEHRYLARNPYVAGPQPNVAVADYERIYPTSQPDPWRLRRGQDPAWVKFYGARETTPQGYFTGASGNLIYRADSLPEPFRGNLFCCESANNLVHRCLLERDGAGFRARRASGEEQSEFLTATDQWFRPVNLATGPDGAIYVVDYYHEIIEDYSAIPRFLQQQYVASLIAGHDRGRIWRIVPVAQAASLPNPRAGTARQLFGGQCPPYECTTRDLIQLLAHANAWWRETVQRLLVERRDQNAVPLLAALVDDGPTPQARLLALYTLDGLEALRPEHVEQALGDAAYGVRVHALRLAECGLESNRPLFDKVLGMVTDTDPSVRLQLAMTLGATRDAKALDALARLAATNGDERWMPAAITSSVADSADVLVAKLVGMPQPTSGAQALLRPLASSVAARRDERQIARLLEITAGLSRSVATKQAPGEQVAGLQAMLLDGVIEGLGRSKPAGLDDAAGQSALERLLSSGSADVRQRALHVAGLVKLAESPAMRAAWSTAADVAADADRPLKERLDAVALLAAAPWSQQKPLARLVDPRQPVELQLAALKTLAAADDAEVAGILVQGFASLSPRVQEAVIDALFARRDRLPALLDAIERGTVAAASLPALRRTQLLEHSQPEIRRRAESLLAGRTGDDRASVLKHYQSALDLPRDPKRGRVVFEKQCAKCHRLHGQGFEVGPDLAEARGRADATLLLDVLDPSSLLTPGYTVYTVATIDGRVFTGVLAAETATSVTLRREQAAADTILRKDIDEMKAASRSMMPDGLEKEVTPQDLADLIGYLRESLGPVEPQRLVLFDDERDFVAALAEGGGSATLDTKDKFSGGAALRISPPQRHSARVAGWHYRIVEKPGPGEYRYLRFAWKSAGADGVMIELAASGSWPPADKPLRRYYAGKNTTGWQAVEIAPTAPTEWTVVTVDLWKDFGPFILTGIAPTAMAGDALFDRIELLRAIDSR